MTAEEHLALHDSQIRRLEQAMTALAEAQVRTEDELERFTRREAESRARIDAQLAQLVETVNGVSQQVEKLTQAQQKTEQHLQAYLAARPKN